MRNLGLEVDEHMEKIFDISFNKRVTMISLENVVPNKNNLDFDTQQEIEQFAEEIYEQGGIRDPLHVYRRQKDNKYVLLGGHKRYYACLINKSRYSDAQRTVPVIIEQQPKDEIEEIILIEELNQHRNYNDKQLLARAKRLYEVYCLLIEKDRKPKGQKREWFAKKLNVGEKKAERLIHIIEGRYAEDQTKLTNKRKLKNAPNEQYEDVRIHLQKKLSTKVKITKNTLVISFEDVNDFNRILEEIGCENVVNE